MYYRHNLDYEYPLKPDEHMITVKRLRSVNVDENYPYLPKTRWYKFKRGLFWLANHVIIFPLLLLTQVNKQTP